MFSLKGAPELNKPQKKAFSYDVALVPPGAEAEAESRIPSGRAEPDPEPQKSKKDKSDRKHKKKDKKEKEKKPKKHVEEDHRELSDDYSSEASTPAKKAVTSKESSYNDDYEDDFEFEPEAVEDDDDFIPPVPSQKKTPPSIASTAVDTKIQERKVEELRAATEAHDRSVAQWKVEQTQKEEELEVKQKELMKQMALFQEKQDSMVSQVANIVNQQASSGEKRTIVSNADEPAGAKSQDEIQKQRRRDREHALLLKRLEEGESTNALFQKLAFDVREVFSELNLAVVAAEKERLIKDERYRREREMKDRREDEQRSQKLEKEISEREKRDADFREYIDQQMKREEEERESRLRRDLEDRAARLRSDKEQREELDRIERDRRLQAEREVQRRDDSALQTQLEEIKLRYHAQLEDYRRQADLDRSHSEELHRTELQMMEKRHEAALNQLSQKHVEQIAHLETHVVNANKLEKLIDNVRTEIDATKKMNERLTEERLNVVRQKETQLEEQKALLNAMLDDTRLSKQELDKERLRVSSMLAKFELAISSFAKNAEEDRHALKSSQDHYETLRQQAEKDRRLMLTEITQERKLLEAQHEEFLSKKMDAMTELQAERTLLSRERAESVALRERQNKDEGETLKLLRAREEEYRHKVESMEDDRTVTRDMKNEQKRLYDSSVAEREALRKERELFELEKEELLGQFNSIRQQAEDASRAQERLRNELVKERSTKQFSPFRADGEARHMDAAMTHATSRLQMDLAKQRAILTKIAS